MTDQDIRELLDIQLDAEWQLTPSAGGDFLTLTGYDCLLQEIQVEALTQEGDLWYDSGFGWSMLDFIHMEDSELTRLEIEQRIREKLSWYQEVETSSIQIRIDAANDILQVRIRFRFAGEDFNQELTLLLNKVTAEVSFDG